MTNAELAKLVGSQGEELQDLRDKVKTLETALQYLGPDHRGNQQFQACLCELAKSDQAKDDQADDE